jgi:uncharacterized repeat protein (TIGR01451 family)
VRKSPVKRNPVAKIAATTTFGNDISRTWFARAATRWVTAGMVLTSCACNAVNRPNASNDRDLFLSDGANQTAVARPAAPGRATARLRPPRVSDIEQAGYVGARHPTPSADGAIQQTAAESRMPLDCPTDVEACPGACPQAGEYFPDEYLCDGGDRALPVHYNEQQMLGLETEDTVVEYKDDAGKRRVRPANKVCIYSPRFAAVVSISGLTEDVGGGRPIQSVATTRGVALKSRDVTVAHNQRDMTERLISRSRGSGLQTGSSAVEFDRPEAIHGHIHTTTPIANYGFLQSGQIRQAEGAWLAESIQSASVWTRDQNPTIVGAIDTAGELRSRFTPTEFVGRENRFNGKGKLRIVKLADKEIAASGDIVTFKIRFDNIGDRDVNEVVIVDNLTPRLEYVDDSATCDRNGQLITEDNGEGSLILRWELDEPLPGRTGGVVTFQARVR